MIHYENRPNENTRIFQKSDIKLKEIIFFNKKCGKIKVGTRFALYISINRKRERKDRNHNEVQL